METFVFVLSIMIWFLCPVIIGLILLQGAAGDISSAFGGGGQLDSTLGVGAHRKMSKVTGFLAGIFFVMILILAYQGRGSLRDAKIKPTQPAVPAPVAKPTAEQPAKPEIVAPAPAKPEAAAPAPAKAEPVVPAPAQPEAKAPAQPEAAVPASAQPEVKAPAADPAPVAASVVPAPLPPAPVVPAQPAPEAKP
jgi:protein translocase SecG subunit